MQVSRTTLKIWPGATQRARPSLRFDERDRFTLRHRLATVRAVRPRQRRGEPEPNDFPVNNGCPMHTVSVRKDAGRNKRFVQPTHVAVAANSRRV